MQTATDCGLMETVKLQALVYHTFHPTTAMTGYATSLGKPSANGVFRWCSNGSMFVTDNSGGTYKIQIVWIETERIFLPGADASHVHVGAWALWLLPQSYRYPDLSEGADRVGGQLHRGKECPFSDVTSSGRVWRKVPKTDARSVEFCRDRDLGGLCFCLVYLLAGLTVMVGVT